MNKSVLVDTDILIDYLKGHGAAIEFLESLSFPILISTISVAELYAGVREGKERGVLDLFLNAFEVVNAGIEVCKKGGLLRRDYGKSTQLSLADAIIVVTASARKVTLASLNRKHFSMIENFIVPYQK